jgi:dienelactone hydrolase
VDITSETEDRGVRRIEFTIPRPEPVPGILWVPEGTIGQRPLVLLGHGGGMHKEAPGVLGLSRGLTHGPGYAAVAIDLPLHGDRVPAQERGLSPRQRRERIGLDAWRERNDQALPQALADWTATLDALRAAELAGSGPVGYFGVSMGTRFGVPLAAAEPRISAAVFGLFGCSDENSVLGQAARKVTIPLLFLLQWDDELFPRADGLNLFDLFGSPAKTMHANPGGHLGLPRAEYEGVVAFFRHHLGNMDAG